MADMDMEMVKPSIIMRTFSKNQRARSPAIIAILKENKGNFCCIIINILLSIIGQ